MDFFQKLKDGANKAADMAQQTVEVAKLNMNISGKQKEVEQHLAGIGRVVLKDYKAGAISTEKSEITRLCNAILALETDISAVRDKIAGVKNLEICKCGAEAKLDAKFCLQCGNRFDTPAVAVDAVIVEQTHKNCTSCGSLLEPESKFCENCGAAQYME